jgi:hypothetical protein
MPTDHGSRRLRSTQNEHRKTLVTGPLSLVSKTGQRWERDSTWVSWRKPERSRVPL